MKVKELLNLSEQYLVEYNQQKTIDNFGVKIVDAAKSDPNLSGLKDKDIITKVLASLEKADPTKNKQFVQWLVREFTKGVKLEDLTSRGADSLIKFELLKKQKKIKPEQSDIGKLSFSQLEDVVHQFDDNEDEEELKGGNRGKYEELHRGSDCIIIQPLDTAAAVFFGQSSRWCTAAASDNKFNEYNEMGPMYIIIPRKPEYKGEKYQMHLVARDIENEKAEAIPAVTLFQRFPIISKVIHHDPAIPFIEDCVRKDLKAIDRGLIKNPKYISFVPSELKTEDMYVNILDHSSQDDVYGMIPGIPKSLIGEKIAVCFARHRYSKKIPKKLLADRAVVNAVMTYDPQSAFMLDPVNITPQDILDSIKHNAIVLSIAIQSLAIKWTHALTPEVTKKLIESRPGDIRYLPRSVVTVDLIRLAVKLKPQLERYYQHELGLETDA